MSTHAQSPREIWNPDYTHAFQVPYGPPVVPKSTVLVFGDAGVPVYLLADAPPGTGWITLSDQRRPGTVAADAPNHGTASALLPMRANNFEWGYANGSVLQAAAAGDRSRPTRKTRSRTSTISCRRILRLASQGL